eukprot:6946_1
MQKLKEGRGKAGTSTWMDQRKNVLADDGIHLAYNRNTKKKVTEFDLSCIETFISYPILDPNGELQFNVQYDDEADTYTNNLSELSDDYPYTLSKLLMATKTENVKKYIDEELTLLNHSHTKGTICYLKYPSLDNKHDRVVIISDYMNENKFALSFMHPVIPKYLVSHIDHKEPELSTETFSLTTTLSNGKNISNGGQGQASESDLIVITAPDCSHKYEYLKIKLFLKDQQMQMYKNHCIEIGKREKNKIGMKLSSWLAPKYYDSEREASIDINSEVKSKELDSLMGRLAGQKIIYGGTKAKQIFEPEYNQSIAIFGNSSIVRTFKPTNAPHFILSVTDLKLTYSPKREKMKIECFIAHVWV